MDDQPPKRQPAHKRILVAPLDWGLGHASRIIPLIHALRSYDRCEVLIGVSGKSGEFLKAEFPALETIDLPSLSVRYSGGSSQIVRIFLQIPRMILSVIQEHRRLSRLVNERGLSAVISDNRYGLYSRKIPSMLVLHQLHLRLPGVLHAWAGMFTRLQQRWISRFDQIWIPDMPGNKSLAGALSQPPARLHNTYHIGLLSRFFYGNTGRRPSGESYPLVALLSGPEPQRSMLEEMVCEQAQASGTRALVIQGVMGDGVMRAEGKITRVSHMLSVDLRRYLQLSRMVVCRSGYSSVMDMVALRKQALLIPTPGQPEQEYLAEYLQQKGWFLYQRQDHFHLEEALRQVNDYFPPRIPVSEQLFRRINRLFEWLEQDESEDQNNQPQTKT